MRVDILDATGGVKQGNVPVLAWSHTSNLDKGGTFRCEVPVSALTVTVNPLDQVRLLDRGSLQASGIVDVISVTPDGAVSLSGDDMARRMALTTMAHTRFPTGTKVSDFVVWLGSRLIPSGVVLNDLLSTAMKNKLLPMEWHNESTLWALQTVAQQCGFHFYLDGSTVVLAEYNAGAATKLNCIQPGIDGVDGASAAIESLSYSQDSSAVVSSVSPYGQDDHTIFESSRNAPDGFVANIVQNTVTRTATEQKWGSRAMRIDFNHIAPVDTSPNGLRDASDYLFDAAIVHLEANAEPLEVADVSVSQSPVRLMPLDIVRVVYRDAVAKLARSLVVVSATTELGSEGLRTTRITAASGAQLPQTEADFLARIIGQGIVRRTTDTSAGGGTPPPDNPPTTPVRYVTPLGDKAINPEAYTAISLPITTARLVKVTLVLNNLDGQFPAVIAGLSAGISGTTIPLTWVQGVPAGITASGVTYYADVSALVLPWATANPGATPVPLGVFGDDAPNTLPSSGDPLPAPGNIEVRYGYYETWNAGANWYETKWGGACGARPVPTLIPPHTIVQAPATTVELSVCSGRYFVPALWGGELGFIDAFTEYPAGLVYNPTLRTTGAAPFNARAWVVHEYTT